MVVTENEQSTLCSFIQWFLAKVSNFMAPSGMFFSWFCFFPEHSSPLKKDLLVYFIWVLITAFCFIVKALLYFMRASV